MKKKAYLDNNASTSLTSEIIDEVIRSLKQDQANPSSVHSLGQKAKASIDAARKQIAMSLKVKPQEIVFTSGATESLNHLIKGMVADPAGAHIITSNVEHAAVASSLSYLVANGASVTSLEVGLRGGVTAEMVKGALRANTRLLVFMSVNNETGVKCELENIAALAREHRIPLIVDAVAHFGKEPFIIYEGISAFCVSGHKIHAPKGIGFSFIKSNVKIASLLHGGEQQFGRRAGTENMAGIAGIAQAVADYLSNENEISCYIRRLRDRFENAIVAELQDVFVNGQAERINNVSNLCFPGIEGESLLFLLDQRGVIASHGSACSSGALEPSQVLLNMGLTKQEAGSSLRFSLSRLTTDEEIDYAAATIIEIVKGLRSKRMRRMQDL